MRFTRKPLAAGVIALATLAAAAGCSSGAPAASSSGSGASGKSAGITGSSSAKGVLNVGDQKGTGAQAVLQASGLINKLPFKVKWSDFTSGPTMVQAMSTGAIDIGGVGDAPPVFAASGGENIEIAGARETKGGDQDAVVVPKGSPIKSISQLKGKKIGISSGSSDDYHLLSVLNKNGISPKAVTMVNLQPAPGLAAFTSKAIDAWDIWPPYVQQLAGQDGARILTVGNPYGSQYSFEVASKSSVQDPAKSKEIATYLKVLNQAYKWTGTHPGQWAKTWAQATGLPSNIMQKAAVQDANVPATITPAVAKSEQDIVDQFSSAGLIPNKIDISKYITSQYNSSAGS